MDKIIRVMDSKNRITIPEPSRRKLDIDKEAIFSFRVRGDEIILTQEYLCDNCDWDDEDDDEIEVDAAPERHPIDASLPQLTDEQKVALWGVLVSSLLGII